jgi:YbbR domain-containing protein
MIQAILRAAKWVRGLIFENIGWKLLSLAAAAAIWAAVATEPELSTFASTQVEYKNLPDDIEIDSNPLATVMLELQGPSGALRDIGEASLRPQVILDMSTAALGQRTFTIEDPSVKLPRGVRLVRSIPSQVRFSFDRRAEASIPVTVPVTGEGRDGYVVASQRSEPARLVIVGPAGHVARIAQAATDPVDVSHAVGTVEYRVNANLSDPYVQFQSSPQVEVTIVMQKK